MDRDNSSGSKDGITLHSLLAHLHSMKEFELYYYLFNEVEIKNIANNLIEISREGSDKSLNNRLMEILSTMTGQKWSLVLVDLQNHLSLKERMRLHFTDSTEWKMIQSNFPESQVLDIILA